MATTAPSGAPTPQTDAERLPVEQPVKESGIRPESLEELAEGLGETRGDVSAVMADVDREPEKRVSFAEAVRLLDGKLDLEVARTDAVKSHGRWRLVDALVKAGAIKDAAEYRELFDEATVKEADIPKVREMIERGEKVLPIFNSGKMIPYKLFAVLFTEGGVPHDTNNYGFKNLERLRKIDPKDIPDLANLAGKPPNEQLVAYKAAYKKAYYLGPTRARVTFTPDTHEVSHTGASAIQDMQAYAKGEMSFLDPNADFLRYRAQMDAGLHKIAGRRDDFDGMTDEAYRAFLDKALADETIDKYMPNRETVTRYPDYAFESGGVLHLGFATDGRKVHVYGADPVNARDGLGSHISFG